MQSALLPRGPDGHSSVLLPSAALTHTRLALLDLPHGAQPLSDPSHRYHLVHNGEIYNHLTLRASLPDYPFRTTSDAETLLAALLAWGESALDRLDGMFAFLLWDSASERAFAARDALGVKPFVFALREQEFLFASEAKAILAQDAAPPSLDPRAVAEYLVAPPLSGVRRSMFQSIEHLGAGERLWIERGRIDRRRWFAYRIPRAADADDATLTRELRAAVEQAVPESLLADVPVGIFLSGGLDSSLLAALACRDAKWKRPLTAYTVRFDQHERLPFAPDSIVISDDAPFVEELAQTLPLDLHRVPARAAELLATLDAAARANDRVPAWEQELTQQVLARAAAGRSKAVLVGDAADETHFGYFFLLDERVHHSPRGLLDRFGAAAREACLAPHVRGDLRPLATLDTDYRALCADAGYDFSSPVERARATTHLVVTLWLGRLLANGDCHTMAHGVEARVPFASRKLLAVAQRVPPTLGFAAGVEKRLLRAAAAPWLPRSIATRKKSALPRDPRVAPLWQFALRQQLADQPAFAREWLDLPAVERLCALPSPGENERGLLFNLLALLVWHRQRLA